MVKILIIRWIIIHCDRESFIGMRWHDRDRGIFWLYWKHQSSRSCKENTAESAAYYEYYRAWARHKNNNRRRQPRDLKAAFRNALEKKPELERLTHMDTKERIYWRIKKFPNGQNEDCTPVQPLVRKPIRRSCRGRNNLVKNSTDFPVNYGASSSTTDEDVILERKKPRRPYVKGSKNKSGKPQNDLANEGFISESYEPAAKGFPESHGVANNQFPLPPFISIKGNDQGHVFWDDSLKNTDSNGSPQPPRFLEPSYDKRNAEELWTPPFFPQTPPQFSSDPMEVSTAEMTDLFIPKQTINYPLQPTPPQEATDILFDNHADLVTLRKLVNGGESTILKYSFPFQPEEISTSQSHLTYTHPATSVHYSSSDFASVMRTSKIPNNNCVMDSQTLLNAFPLDQNHCSSYDQIVPSYSFQTSQQLANTTSEIFVNDYLLYSPPSVGNHGEVLEEMYHQQEDIGGHTAEIFEYTYQTSHDDSGISDMEDFLDDANKLLDNIDSQCGRQCPQMC